MTELPFTLTNRQVRDLAWACFSPPLLHTEQLADDQHNVANCGLSLTPTRQHWLQQLDRKPAALNEFLSQKAHTRLGLYFEQLWHFFLREDPDVDLLAHNLPVREGAKTLGEFDCLYFCHQRQRHYHLELAVKYFLAYHRAEQATTTRSWRAWLGPNSRDRLDLKVEHMMQRQIRLSEQPAAQALLSSLGIDSLAGEVEIKGWLFGNAGETILPPRGHNAARPVRHWLRIEDLHDLLAVESYSGLALLPRLQWLAPARREDTEVLPPATAEAQLHNHFQRNNRPVLVAAFGNAGIELDRFFVTGQDWPQRYDELSG